LTDRAVAASLIATTGAPAGGLARARHRIESLLTGLTLGFQLCHQLAQGFTSALDGAAAAGGGGRDALPPPLGRPRRRPPRRRLCSSLQLLLQQLQLQVLLGYRLRQLSTQGFLLTARPQTQTSRCGAWQPPRLAIQVERLQLILIDTQARFIQGTQV